jgi:tetratricopeptide (TPR) repeat protein
LEEETDWLSRFGVGLLRYHQGDHDEARTIWQSLAEEPSAAFFYLVRGYASLDSHPETAVQDLEKSLGMKENWRIYSYLAHHFLKRQQLDEAEAYARRGFERHPGIAALGILRAEILGIRKDYAAALSLLDTLVVLPYEGAGEGRKMYEWLVAGHALQAAADGRPEEALRRLDKMDSWNERLGSGKPLDYTCWLKHVTAVAIQSFQATDKRREAFAEALEELMARFPDRDAQLKDLVRQEEPYAPLSLRQVVKGYWKGWDLESR